MFRTYETQEDCDVCGTFDEESPRIAIEFNKVARKREAPVRIVLCSDCKYELDSQLSRVELGVA